jgi:hypothetical protein
MADLAKDREVAPGVRASPLAEFALRLKDAVTEAGVGKDADAGLWMLWGGLPAELRGVLALPTNWDGLVSALQNVPQLTLATIVDAYKKTEAMEEKINFLTNKLNSVRIANTPPSYSPSSPLRSASAPSVPTVPNAPPPPEPPAPVRQPRKQGTEAEKAVLRRLLVETIARKAPDTPEGRVLHAKQGADWEAKNGHIPRRNVAVELTGYPLTPGTADPLSGECWKCGIAGHRGRTCGRPALPDLETRFRQVCYNWLGLANVPQVNVVEDVAQGRPWYEEEDSGGHIEEVEEEGFVPGQR